MLLGLVNTNDRDVRMDGMNKNLEQEDSVQAPLMWLRQCIWRVVPRNLLQKVAQSFVELAPASVQRECEVLFDFPISKIVRGNSILLIRVPKTASVSLAIQVYGRISHIPHRTANFYASSDPEFFRQVNSFAVVRDPLERLRSSYRWLSHGGTSTMVPVGSASYRVRQYRHFDAFVSDYLLPASVDNYLHKLDATVHRQSDYICGPSGDIIVKNLFSLERMDLIQRFLKENGVMRGEHKLNVSSQKDVAQEPEQSFTRADTGNL